MHDAPLEVLADVLPTLLYGIGSLAFTALGLSAELESLHEFGGGETFMAVWFAWIGLVTLYIGVYLLGYGKLLGGRAAA